MLLLSKPFPMLRRALPTSPHDGRVPGDAAARLSAQSEQVLRWGGDAEGGAPFVEADPNDPSRARRLRRRDRGHPGARARTRAAIRPGRLHQPRRVGRARRLRRRPERHRRHAGPPGAARRHDSRITSSARCSPSGKPDAARYRSLARPARPAGRHARRDARLRPAAVAAEQDFGVVPVTYEDDVHPYSDLALGRVDAVLLDQVLAERASVVIGRWSTATTTSAVGHYVGVLAPANAALRDRMNDDASAPPCATAGSRRSSARWGVWNDDQAAPLCARLAAGHGPHGGLDAAARRRTAGGRAERVGVRPAVLAGAAPGGRRSPCVLSCLSMALAVVRRRRMRARPRVRPSAAAGPRSRSTSK